MGTQKAFNTAVVFQRCLGFLQGIPKAYLHLPRVLRLPASPGCTRGPLWLCCPGWRPGPGCRPHPLEPRQYLNGAGRGSLGTFLALAMTVEGQEETLTVHSSGTQHLLLLLWVWGDLLQGDLHRSQVRTKIIHSVCVLCNKKALETSSTCWQPAERLGEKKKRLLIIVMEAPLPFTYPFHLRI